jgi:hypothetical protein
MLLYCLTGTPLALVLTTLLATADRSHYAAVHATAEGIQLVLLHDCVNSPTHRHGIVARTLILVAQPPIEGHPDHVIEFASSTVSHRASEPAIAPAPDSSVTQLLSLCDLSPCPAPLTPVATAHPRPPPEANGLVLTLRSTVLLL